MLSLAGRTDLVSDVMKHRHHTIETRFGSSTDDRRPAPGSFKHRHHQPYVFVIRTDFRDARELYPSDAIDMEGIRSLQRYVGRQRSAGPAGSILPPWSSH